jgi:hypothetical protein
VWSLAWLLRATRGYQGRVVGGVSILKPIRGRDPAMREAIASHVNLQGEYELLCGVSRV